MKYSRALGLIVFCLLLQSRPPSTQRKASKIFFLEDTGTNQWCAYNREATWKAAVRNAEAMTVGTLIYSDGHLSQIYLTETDQSGDWMVYDHYFLDDHGRIVKLSRMINVLPGDRSVLQTFSIRDGKATKSVTKAKELSTGETLTSPEPVWLPEVPIETSMGMFAFSGLLRRPGLRITNKTCVKAPGTQ
jgi:hypothetical protein